MLHLVMVYAFFCAFLKWNKYNFSINNTELICLPPCRWRVQCLSPGLQNKELQRKVEGAIKNNFNT